MTQPAGTADSPADSTSCSAGSPEPRSPADSPADSTSRPRAEAESCAAVGHQTRARATADAVEQAYRAEWGRIVSTLIRITGDWTLAEDCTQEAFETAVSHWGRDGVPPNPGGWLTIVAKNRAIDRLRRITTEASKLREVGMDTVFDELEREDIEDDRLRLIFTCCHPALTLESRVALTLRTVAGLTTPEIARAFLVPEATMAQRLVRAKAKIKNAGIPYRVPEGAVLGERIGGVLAVLYLLFNEGYSASSGDALIRADLASEAIRVTRLLVALMPDEPEASGLLALMLLQHSRRNSRADATGDLLTLEEQDRRTWDRVMIDEGDRILRRSLARQRPGRYQIQAVIAATYATAPSFSDTDFEEASAAWTQLVALDPSPVVALNRAIAVGMWRGAAEGLAQVEKVAAIGGATLAGYYLLPATRADFLRRLGRHTEAAHEYRAALELAPTEPERRFLRRRIREVGE